MLLSCFYRPAFFSWLLLITLEESITVSGQGVRVEHFGVTLPSDSFVDFDDIPNDPADPGGGGNDLEVINCRTDLEACCNMDDQMLPAPVGEWYYPNGTALDFDVGGATFRRNRFQSNVRLWRRGTPLERGRFHCEVPNAQNVNQTVYVNILNIGPVTITASGGSNTGIAGTSFSLVCSATVETQNDTPTPNFDWFFGTNNGSLPSGATPMATVMGNTNTSTLQFSPLQESHAGMYTCRLGSNARLAVISMVTVNRPTISVIISDSGSPVLGESGYVLNCDVTGDENLTPTITYQWTRDNGNTQTQVGTNTKLLSFSSLSLSDAGQYTCSVTVSSPYLNSNVMATSESGNSPFMAFQVPNPSVTVTSNVPTPIHTGTSIVVTCAVEMAQGVVDSDLSLLMVDAQLSRDGTPLTLTGPTVTGTTFTYTIQLDSFGRNDSGNYTCSATVRPRQNSIYLIGSGVTTAVTEIVTGVYVSLRRRVYSNHNMINIFITDIGEGDESLLCFAGLIQCCRDSDTPSGVGALGRWLYPNGSLVGEKGEGGDFYTERGLGVVRLNRRNNVTSPTGQFCCEVPDASSTTTRICMNTFNPQISPGSTTTDARIIQTGEVIAITVSGTILIEFLIATPIIITIVVSLRCRKKRKSCDKKVVTAGEGYVYEDPDKLISRGQGNYELTQCPAYESNTTKPEPPPTGVDQSSYYEI